MDLHGGITDHGAAEDRTLNKKFGFLRTNTRRKTPHTLSPLFQHHWSQGESRKLSSRTARRSVLFCGLYLFVISISLIKWAEALEGSEFHSRLRNAIKSKPTMRQVRSLENQDEGMYFDSRVHRSLDEVPSERSNEDHSDYPYPSESQNDTSYSYGDMDYDAGVGFPRYDSINEMVTKLYRGPVCALVDVRNTPADLRDLENCTVVNGFVQIIFMHNTKESDFEQYTFPKLRVITEFLLVYRVYGLRSLRKMFPNLAVIKGREVFDRYGLVIYENPQLQDIGLESLRYIERGGVRIQKNSKLCYLDTVDWKRLGMLGDKVVNDVTPVIKDNVISEDETCLDQCGDEGECVDETTGIANCWGHKLCQQPLCPGECPYACENGRCVCHEECLGGCTAPNNASECHACRNKYHDGVCVPECPEGTYLENDWRCVTLDWCLDYSWVPHEGKCLNQCPPGHRRVGTYCEYCGTSCRETDCNLDEYIVTNAHSLRDLRKCVKIEKRLSINILPGDDLLRLLEEAFMYLEEVGSLAIRRAESLVSLGFMRNLKRITGEESSLIDGTYSLYVLDNQNLRELFPTTNTSNNNSLKIDGGKAFFHFNRKLCMKEVDKIRQLTAEKEDDKDISETTNGDRATCDMLPLKIFDISHMPIRGDTDYAAVRVKWEKVDIGDHRTLIGYQVLYKESKYKNATRYEGLYACGKSSSSWMIKDHLIGPREARLQENSTVKPDAVLPDLKPFTQYALYVRTYTISSAQKGAQSNITYFTTQPSKPSEPVSVVARSINTTAMSVEWKPPNRPNGNITHYILRWRRQDEDLELFRSVDMCKQGKATFAPKPIVPSQPPSTPSTTPTVEKKKKDCCSCNSGKILPSHEEEANNNVNFEDFLHKSIFQTRFLYADYDYGNGTRRRRSLDNDSDYTDGVESWELNSTRINATEGYAATDQPFDFTYSPEYFNQYNYDKGVAMDTHYTLTGLHHFSEYVIQVFACNHASHQGVNDTLLMSMGDFTFYEVTSGCSMDALIAKRVNKLDTGDNIPEEGFRLIEKDRDDGRPQPALAWEPPPEPNGYIKYYEVDLQQKQGAEFKSAPEYFCISMNEYEKMQGVYVIPTHVAAGKYRARVRAVSLAGNGEWTKFAALEIPDRTAGPEKTEQYVWIVAMLAVVIIITLSLMTLWCYKKKKKEEARNKMTYSSANPEYMSLAANYVPDGYEVDEEDVEFVKLIGHGNFGKVFLGFAKKVIKGQERTEVAIKKLHEKSGIHRRIEFLEEAKLMKAFNSTHVVRLLGVVSQTPDPMVIMEYMAKGDLKSHLRSRREDAERDGDDCLPPPTLQERLQMAAEIADGMAYLAGIKFVHRDLAARNCLVSQNGVVKIGDFGLTRDVYETDYYRKDSRGLLPIRWMAPESLRDGIFDSQSDVWSYGVVIWEIATLAEQPYRGIQHDEVTRYVIDGGYMEKPKNCPKKLYDLMLNCWQFNPEMRPKFVEILASLSNDVSKRFKEDSYYYEQIRAKQAEAFTVIDKMTWEEMSLFNGDAFLSRDGSFRIVTPLNVTPSRSRSDTPCGCNTPASRNSNGSAKIGCEFSSHCDHLKRVDASVFGAVQPTGIAPGLKHSSSMNNAVPRKGNGFVRKCESFTHRATKKPSPRQKKTPPSTSSGRVDDIFNSVSTSGIENDFDLRSSEDSTTPQVVAREPENLASGGTEQGQPATSGQSDAAYATLSSVPLSKVNLHHDLANGLRHSPDMKNRGNPYAHMNGFAKRHNSQTNRQITRPHPSKKTPFEDESSYVETSPQKTVLYLRNHTDPAIVPLPPPSFPPPIQPLLRS